MSLIANFQTDTIKINRFAVGEYVNGNYVPGAITEINISAVIIPLSGKDLLNLPEAQRTKEARRVYTDIQLFTADEVDSKKADRFLHDGIYFEIQRVEKWTNTDLPHYKCIAVKTDSYEGERI